MPAGQNAVKGLQGFQPTEKPVADIAEVDVAANAGSGASDDPAGTRPMYRRIDELWRQRDDIEERISLLSAKALAMEARNAWPNAATVEIGRDDSSESFSVRSVSDAEGGVIAESMVDDEIDDLHESATGIQLGRDHSERFLAPLGPDPRAYRDINADEIDIDRALAIDTDPDPTPRQALLDDSAALADALSTVPPHWVAGMDRHLAPKVRGSFAEAADALEQRYRAAGREPDHQIQSLIAEMRGISDGVDPRGGTFKDQAARVSNRIAIEMARRMVRAGQED